MSEKKKQRLKEYYVYVFLWLERVYAKRGSWVAAKHSYWDIIDTKIGLNSPLKMAKQIWIA